MFLATQLKETEYELSHYYSGKEITIKSRNVGRRVECERHMNGEVSVGEILRK